MPAVQDIDGAVVRLWLRLAADELDRARAAIDGINVFPVADAYTGTNMHKTIACAAQALAGLPEHASTADIWQAAAAAALQGACGNSGIILSQLLCGLADTCGPASPCDGQVVALALAKAAALARAAVHRPVEGTVLTVADAAARAAAHAAAQPADLPGVGQAAATGAREALLRTRQQLEVLAASGVVDAGGAGLCVLLDALSAAISGRRGSFAVPVPMHRASAAPAGRPASEFSYEVTYLLDAAEDAVAALRDRLDLLGDSLVVSGRAPRWHVHVHVADAGAVIESGLTAGRLSKITITYLNQAHPGIAPARPVHGAVVAVAAGAGLAGLLRAAGAKVVASAGELDALRDELAGEPAAVLLAPGGRFAERWPPGWPVLATGSEIQLLAALAVHDPQHDSDADLAAMSQAIEGMRWGAVRRREPGGTAAARMGPIAGLLAGEPAAAGQDEAEVAVAVTDLLITGDTEMLTLVTGEGASPGLAGLVASHVAERAPGVEVICYDGGMTDSLLQIGAE